MNKLKGNYIEAFVKLFLVLVTLVVMTSCTTYRLSTLYHDPIYDTEFIIPVADGTKIDTLDSFRDLKWKLKTDFRFRYDFATYATNQPYSWYFSNRLFSNYYWSPFNSFDVYFNRHNFWYDWAFNYPYDYGWSWNRWNYRWGYYYNWHRPYHHWNNWYLGPWQNPSYNVIWNSSRNNTNVAYVYGRRGSRNMLNNNIVIPDNSNIQNNIITRYNKPRRVNNSNLDNVVNELRNNNLRVRVYNNPNNFENDQINRNNIRTNWSTQSNNNGRGSWSRQVVPSRSTVTPISTPVQSRQVRGGSGSSVSQQSRSSVSSGGQGRGSCSRC